MKSESYIVSLSSIPSRFSSLGPVLSGYLSQSIPPEKVIVYIPKTYRRFPDYDGSLPDVPDGVEIRQPEVDYGPATKVLHAVRDFADIKDGKQLILFGDDDLIYEPDWAERLLAGHAQHPDAVVCSKGFDMDFLGLPAPSHQPQPRGVEQNRATDWQYRLRKLSLQLKTGRLSLKRHEKPSRRLFKCSGFIDLFEGYGGVLVQPRFLDDDAYVIPDVVWAVDDIWLSGIVTKNGVPIWVEADSSRFRYTPTRHTDALNQSVIEGADRTQANVACVRYMQNRYGIWT